MGWRETVTRLWRDGMERDDPIVLEVAIAEVAGVEVEVGDVWP